MLNQKVIIGTPIYKLHYDAFHQLAEALVYFDKIKVKTHECLFAYLGQKYPELEFSWEFLEQLRIKMNRSIYYGEPLKYLEWKNIELQLQLYITTLHKSIQERLSSFSDKKREILAGYDEQENRPSPVNTPVKRAYSKKKK